MKLNTKVLAGIVGSIPVITAAADFHWPKFNIDTTPVEPLKLGDISSQVSASIGSLGVIIVIGALVAGVWGYAKALKEVKAGRLIVYKDWGDFIKSSAWILLIPLGMSWFSDESMDSLFHMIGLGAIVYGCYCFWQMVSRAFKYNVGNAKWLSLFARFAVTMLMLFALAKLNEEFENYKRGKYGYKYRYFAFMRGVILPLAIFAWVFKLLIQPMVGTQYYRLRRSMGGW